MSDRNHSEVGRPNAIVGIGAAGGGLAAMEPILHDLPSDLGAAVVVVQHLGAETGDALRDVITNLAPMQVRTLGKTPTRPQANHIYVASRQSRAELTPEGLVAVEEPDAQRRASVVDSLFQSLADHAEVPVIGIVLSGSGGDGTLGLRAIRDSGGLTIAQDPETAKHPEMPRNAALADSADCILPPDRIVAELRDYLRHVAILDQTDEESVRNHVESLLPRICDVLLTVTEYDFRHYKLKTLIRRVLRRMQLLRMRNPDDYLQRLQEDREEAHALFRELLVSVTAFFRDPDTFSTLANLVLPKLFEQHDSDDPIRVWVPGCATGEEAYTLAILMHEERERHSGDIEVQLFATDIDQRALNIARGGVYPASIAQNLTAQRLERYFRRTGTQYVVVKEIRDMCAFSVHNLISDPPFSQLDLISCRNLLIYLGQPLQLKLIPLFHFALKPHGYLLLGPSEAISSHAELFRLLDKKHRISQRKPGPSRTDAVVAGNGLRRNSATAEANQTPNETDLFQISQRIVLDEFAPRYAVINDESRLVCSSTGLERYFEFPDGPFQNNVVKMAKPGLRSGLRAAIRESQESLRTVTREDLTLKTPNGPQRIKLVVQPMPEVGEDIHLFLVVFYDLGSLLQRTHLPDSGGSSVVSDAESTIERLEMELDQSRTDLEQTVQELEGSNEELKSSNEELRSLNEELHSANEELRTSKEEIEAGMEALAHSKSDLQNLLEGIEIATIYLDRHGNVNSFTPSVRDIYHIREVDIGRPLREIMHRADEMPQLPDAELVAAADSRIEHEIRTDEDRWFRRRVLPYRHAARSEGLILTFVDITEKKRSEMRLVAAHGVTQLLAGAESFDEVVPQILETIRTSLHAGVCLLWLVDSRKKELYCEEVAVADDRPEFTPFVLESRNTRLRMGEGVPGRAWQTKEPEWVEDIADRPNFVRREIAKKCGLVSGMAMPIVTGKRFRGVIEFYADGPRAREQSLLDMLAEVGHEIGQFIRRTRLQDRFRNEEARKTAILQAALDCIITMDVEGRIVDFNKVAEQTFGRSQAEVTGRLLAEVIVPEEFQSAHRRGLERYLRTGQSEIVGKRIELIGLRANGDRFPVELAINVSHSRDGAPFFTGYLRDITERKQSEQRLVESEARSRQLADVVERCNEFIGIATPDGQTIYINEAGRRMIGFDNDQDISERQLWDFVAEKDRPLIRDEAIPAMKRHGRWDGPVHLQNQQSGELIPTLWNSFVIQYPGGGIPEAWVTISSDLRETQRLEAAVRENEQRLAMALQSGRMAAWEWTPSKSVWTGALFELLGIPSTSEPSTELFFRSVHPDDLPRLQEAWRQATAGVRPYDAEFRIVRPSGEVRWLKGVGEIVCDESGSIERIYGLNWDITEHKESQHRKEREAEIEHFLLDASSTLFSSLDSGSTLASLTRLCVPTIADWAFIDLLDEQGEARRIAVAHADPAHADLARQVARFPARPELLEHPPSRGLFGGEGFVIPEFTDQMIRPAAQSEEHERIIRKVGPQSFVVVPLAARGESFGALTLVMSDSGRRYSSDDLKVAQQLAQRASIAIDNSHLFEAAQSANRAKSEFVANMSHEIRTPMTAVLGYTDLLAGREDDREKLELLNVIRRNGNFLLEIINDILDLSKIEAGKMEIVRESFPPHRLVADVRSMMQVRAAEKNLQFEVTFDGRLPEQIESDPKRLRQILVNLVGNAIKFTDAGRVQLVVSFIDDPHDPQLRFDVVDTGIGISSEQQARLFMAFSQGDASVTRTFGGTGLGLAISQRLARMLGGEVSFVSEPGRGSTFSCTISTGEIGDAKFIEPTIELVTEDQPPAPATRRLSCRVLVVDDQRDVRFLARTILEQAGADVEVAEDGVAATERVQQMLDGGPEIDLLLLDMQMPRLDGYRSAARLREMGFRRPIIALTADAMHGDMDRCLSNGCDAYLSKPIDARELLEVVARHVEAATIDPKTNGAPSSDGKPFLHHSMNNAPKPRVLIVDDSVDACKVVRMLLQLKGFEAAMAHTGPSAIETAKTFGPEFVLLDINLPGLNGYEVLQQLKDHPDLAATKFFALTGHRGDEHRESALAAGFTDYFVKPVSTDILLQAMQRPSEPRELSR